MLIAVPFWCFLLLINYVQSSELKRDGSFEDGYIVLNRDGSESRMGEAKADIRPSLALHEIQMQNVLSDTETSEDRAAPAASTSGTVTNNVLQENDPPLALSPAEIRNRITSCSGGSSPVLPPSTATNPVRSARFYRSTINSRTSSNTNTNANANDDQDDVSDLCAACMENCASCIEVSVHALCLQVLPGCLNGLGQCLISCFEGIRNGLPDLEDD